MAWMTSIDAPDSGTDFGLLEKARGLNGSVFETVSGSRVIVRDRADCGVPEWFEGDGGKLVVWGVDTADNLETAGRWLGSRPRGAS